jgi:hypothetical protein
MERFLIFCKEYVGIIHKIVHMVGLINITIVVLLYALAQHLGTLMEITTLFCVLRYVVWAHMQTIILAQEFV